MTKPPGISGRVEQEQSQPSGARQCALGLVAPSSFLVEAGAIERAAAWFTAQGWHVKVGSTCHARSERFAGPDELRAAEFNRFCCDSALDVVMAARGGYGLTRILPLIDFPAIARRGLTIVGYSDFTAFTLGLLATSGAVSWQGPSGTDFGRPTVDPFTAAHFMQAVACPDVAIDFAAEGPACQVTGVLWGGNLALMCALIGTRWWPSVRDGILFVEDVNEPAYRIERMLLQLEHAGVLGLQSAILLGSFEPVPVLANDNGFDRAAVVAGLRRRLSVPVVDGLPFGHGPRKLTLPVGVAGTLHVNDGHARLSWCRSQAR